MCMTLAFCNRCCLDWERWCHHCINDYHQRWLFWAPVSHDDVLIHNHHLNPSNYYAPTIKLWYWCSDSKWLEPHMHHSLICMSHQITLFCALGFYKQALQIIIPSEQTIIVVSLNSIMLFVGVALHIANHMFLIGSVIDGTSLSLI